MEGGNTTPDKIPAEEADPKGADKGPERSDQTEPGVAREHHVGEAGEKTTPDLTQELRRASDVINEALRIMEGQRRGVEELEKRLETFDVGQIRRLEEKVEELSARLPQMKKDEKAEIKGYYDFDGMTHKYANEATEADYAEAKKNMDALIRGTLNG